MNQIRSRINALRRKTKTALRGELVQLPHLPTRRRSKDSRRLSGYVNELHDTCNSERSEESQSHVLQSKFMAPSSARSSLASFPAHTLPSPPRSCHARPQPAIPAPSLSFPRRRESSPRSQARIKRQ